MGDMGSLWGAEHGDMEEMGLKLLYTSLELEKLKSEAIEETTKHKQYINHLIQLLKCAIEERDEARNQLQKLIMYSSTADVDSLLDAAAFVQDSVSSFPNNSIDQGSLIVENLSKGRVLPQKGMLLQAVVEAGPLLQTLLVAGPLPRWRNPPQFVTIL